MSVLTDQVEAQGEKIRDLESSLEGHRQKLASTEEMLQQVKGFVSVQSLLLSRSAARREKDGPPCSVSYSGFALSGATPTAAHPFSNPPFFSRQ